MKIWSVLILAALFLSLPATSRSQFKGQAERERSSSGGLITQEPSSFFFGWFDPSRFAMHHSFEMSYMTLGGQGMSLGTYTNSMSYKFADDLDVQTDISMSYSPSNSFSGFGGQKTKDFSGIYLSRAQVNYRPWENVTVQLQYRQLPYGSSYFSPFYHPWYGESGF